MQRSLDAPRENTNGGGFEPGIVPLGLPYATLCGIPVHVSRFLPPEIEAALLPPIEPAFDLSDIFRGHIRYRSKSKCLPIIIVKGDTQGV